MTLTVGTDRYISATDADSYFANRLYSTVWTAAASTDKEKTLRMAARALDRENFLATIATTVQTMAWPRAGVVDLEGRAIDPTVVPQAYLTDDPTQDDGTRGVRRMVADSVTMEYDGRAPSRRLPDIVMALIKPFLAPGSGGTSSVALVCSDMASPLKGTIAKAVGKALRRLVPFDHLSTASPARRRRLARPMPSAPSPSPVARPVGVAWCLGTSSAVIRMWL